MSDSAVKTRRRNLLKAGITSVAAAAAITFSASNALAAESINQAFPPKPAGLPGTVSGAVGPGPYDLTIEFLTPEGPEYITTIQGDCVQQTCPIQDTPAPGPGETLGSATLTGTAPVFFEVS